MLEDKLPEDQRLELLFFRGSGPVAWLIRLLSRAEYPNMPAVPAHVAIRVEQPSKALCASVRASMYVESIISGVRAMPFWRANLCGLLCIVTIPGLSVDNGNWWLLRQIGDPYDYWAIALDILYRCIGKRQHMRLQIYSTDRWDCSRLVCGYLHQAGVIFSQSDWPEWPSDVLATASAIPGATVRWAQEIECAERPEESYVDYQTPIGSGGCGAP